MELTCTLGSPRSFVLARCMCAECLSYFNVHMSLFANKFPICQALVCPQVFFFSFFFASNNTCVRGWVYVCACVYLASRQKQLRLSSCRVPQEPRSFPAQHITLQNYRGRSWWKMRLILDRNYCSNPQAPTPACFFFFLSLALYASFYLLYLSIHFLHFTGCTSSSPFFFHS